jgi:hypothetical protein
MKTANRFNDFSFVFFVISRSIWGSKSTARGNGFSRISQANH